MRWWCPAIKPPMWVGIVGCKAEGPRVSGGEIWRDLMAGRWVVNTERRRRKRRRMKGIANLVFGWGLPFCSYFPRQKMMRQRLQALYYYSTLSCVSVRSTYERKGKMLLVRTSSTHRKYDTKIINNNNNTPCHSAPKRSKIQVHRLLRKRATQGLDIPEARRRRIVWYYALPLMN